MSGFITCPNCTHQFAPTDAFKQEVEKEVNAKAEQWRERFMENYKQKEAAKEAEFLQKEQQFTLAQQQLQVQLQQATINQQNAIQQALAQQKATLQQALQQEIKSQFENDLLMLKQKEQANAERLVEARKRELELLQTQQQLQTAKEEAELQFQRKLLEEKNNLKLQSEEAFKQKAAEKEQEFELRAAELKKQLDDQKKLIEEMKRKAEQGSMQLQGEIQEIALEDMLKASFPIDVVAPVAKGVRGADCILTIRTPLGQEAGTILFESKRTKEFAGDWIEKLKADMRAQRADVAIIVTQAMPKDMQHFGEKNGVYICSFLEVKPLVAVLRTSILKIYESQKSQENKGEKMAMLYNYLTSTEFSEQWKAISDGFKAMRQSILTERTAMEKMWKQREKHLDSILLNAAHIKGSMEGIAGMENEFNLIDTSGPQLEA